MGSVNNKQSKMRLQYRDNALHIQTQLDRSHDSTRLTERLRGGALSGLRTIWRGRLGRQYRLSQVSQVAGLEDCGDASWKLRPQANWKLRPLASWNLTPLVLAIGLLVLGPLQLSCAQSSNLVEAEEKAFLAAVARVAPSVVQIETFGGLERVDEELVAEGPTTGTVVAADGWIISTLYSFRQQPASILVTLPGGQRAAARIVARDFSREVALLKVDVQQPLPVAEFAPKAEVQVGQWAVALGKTYDKNGVSQSVGIVSAVDRAYGKAIQTDAKVSPINYGGPLVDVAGRVMGILSPISPGAFLEGDSSQLYDSGIGFAIPIADILERLPRLQQGEDIHAGKLGVVSANQNEFLGPVRISGAAPGSPAAKVQMKPEDVIISAGGNPVSMLYQLKQALGPVDAGQSLAITVQRGEEKLNLEPTLVEKIPVYRRRYLGLRLKATDQGLQIEQVEPDSPADKAGLRAGQTIAQCNDQPLKVPSDLQNILAVAELDTPLSLQVLSDNTASTDKADKADKADDTDNTGNTGNTDSADGANDSARQWQVVEVPVATWPVELAEALPEPANPSATDAAAGQACEVVDVVLGDFPNKAFAIIPPDSAKKDLGLLIVFPEPGELDRDKTKAYWSDFCKSYGWIVAVINSGDAGGWSREEIGLGGRVIGRLSNNYQIDKSRTVMCGLGVGGRIALSAALMENQRVSGALTAGTDLKGLRWPQANAPMQSLDFLLIGDAKQLSVVAESLTEMGYAANALAAPNLELGKWESLPQPAIQRWLEGLGRY